MNSRREVVAQHRNAVLGEHRRLPPQLQQRLVERADGLRIADDHLDAEHVLDERSEVPQLFVRPHQAIEPENRVHDLVPDLLLSLDAADHLVDAPLVHARRLILDDVGDEGRVAPLRSVVIAEPPQLAVAEIEVGLRVEIARRNALHQREALFRRLDFADDDALERVGRIEKGVAQQLADAVQLFLAAPDHAGEGGPHVGQPRAAELEDVDLVRRRARSAGASRRGSRTSSLTCGSFVTSHSGEVSCWTVRAARGFIGMIMVEHSGYCGEHGVSLAQVWCSHGRDRFRSAVPQDGRPARYRREPAGGALDYRRASRPPAHAAPRPRPSVNAGPKPSGGCVTSAQTPTRSWNSTPMGCPQCPNSSSRSPRACRRPRRASPVSPQLCRNRALPTGFGDRSTSPATSCRSPKR